jgi:G3E family GTPase
MAGTAVVVNEFGAVGIDDAIFAQATNPNDVLLLANGCLCCTAGDDLSVTMAALLARADRPNRIIIETTGLADPVTVVLRLMADSRLQSALRIAGIVATVDAVNGASTLSTQAVAERQAAVADLRIITKGDLVVEFGTVQALSERLVHLNPSAEVVAVAHGAISADELLRRSFFDPFGRNIDPNAWLRLDTYRTKPLHIRQRDFGFRTDPVGASSWVLEEEGRIDWDVLSPRIARVIARNGDDILRMKGILLPTDEDPRPLILHTVQRLFYPPVRMKTFDKRRRSTIVVIGSPKAESSVAELADAMRLAAE